MFQAFRDFLTSITDAPDRTRDDDPRVAAAALLYHVGAADGLIGEAELASLRASLALEFGLDAPETEALLDAGREADQDAVDLYRFTSVLMQNLDEAARIRFIELLWEVTYADGEVHELEDNTVWRVADLLGVSTRDRMLMKQEAAARQARRGDASSGDA
ncbi:tellurite resistance TerB family protein [Aureimonas glaciei]|jgi:uncharacterized tellurite resistance protein B-like protein|uniref:Co-chaperone DjlA N-terminal domain-containing protein n=1 Tax=Aureimonas glaciei TaxID=1776957 RepID=A0A916YDM6_9HYPH|nr:TerB family tellurite resistance protein [Aureimonas glaciei]GGD41279.1 hypothetical protein GCM10011335_50030 [Aureimonas glaciei]